LLLSASSSAAPPTIGHQGVLLDAAGAPLNGTISLSFRILAAATGGTSLWAETHPAVPVVDGTYAVELGSITAFGATLFDGSERWLEVSVDGELLSPRQRISSVPYALHAPIAGISALAGKPCNAANPLAGNLVVSFAHNGAVMLSCSNVYTLTVSNPAAGGVGGLPPPVTSSPPGISCNLSAADCTENYVGGTVVQLTAVSTGLWLFTGWSGACTGTGSCSITMDANKSVTANYVQNL
jgi:hypothetical protein